MDDKKIKELLQQIKFNKPDEATKNASISEALLKFEKNVKNTQGVRKPVRLIDNASMKEWFINLISGNFMNSQLAKGLTYATVLLGTVFTSAVVYDNHFNKPQVEEYAIRPVAAISAEEASQAAAPSERAALAQVQQDSTSEKELYKAKTESSLNIAARAEKKTEAYAGHAKMIAAPAPVPASMYEPQAYIPQPQSAGDKFQQFESNKFVVAAENSVSTFSIDVDTTSYSYTRKTLSQGALPQKDAVRLEEMVNYFSYDYALPETKAEPFAPTVSIYPNPWNKNTKLMHIGIKGYDLNKAVKPSSNLVFLIDTSGSMNSPDKLPLLKQAFSMLVDNLSANDTISIVTYAGSAGVALEPTKVSDKAKILAALDNLTSGGSTAGEAGIITAYNLAEKSFNKESVNRVMLATDGDFNVGISNPDALKKLIEEKRDAGIFLSVLGFGQGNYNDAIMQSLAQNGNGNAAYIDNLSEARKVLVNEASSTLFPIANDVKIQVEFNPSKVKEYKLLGYETRALNREDFNNDKVDAGDIGAGSTVTAIYEVVTQDSNHSSVDPLRYSAEKLQSPNAEKPTAKFSQEYAFLKIRYKLPNESVSKLITKPIDNAVEHESIATVNPEVKFATSVAAFSLLLRNDISNSDMSYADVAKLAEEGKGQDKFGSRQEFINIVKNAQYIK